MTASRYLTIKRSILRGIRSGRWGPGDLLPSENQLAARHKVSRMTARRALTELTRDGVLRRSQGAGTYVADQMPMGSLLEIHSIDQEIAARGHQHASEVLELRRCTANQRLADVFQLRTGSPLFFSRILHREGVSGKAALPIQLELRWVNAALVPDYDRQDFTVTTPSQYLTQVAPLCEADHVVEACLPNKDIAASLAMTLASPCLKLTRTTRSRFADSTSRSPEVVALAELFHPGERYRLGGHLTQGESRR